MDDQFEAVATPDVAQESVITSRLLEAFLACPTKCRILSTGEFSAGTEYTEWAAAREESYRREGVRKLTSHAVHSGIASPGPGLWEKASWQFAVAETVQAQGWEADIALVQRILQEGATTQFVPIRFVANNKLSGSDKMLAAFEAITLAKALGTKESSNNNLNSCLGRPTMCG